MSNSGPPVTLRWRRRRKAGLPLALGGLPAHEPVCVYRTLSLCQAVRGQQGEAEEEGGRPLISSFWSQPLWTRELPLTHGNSHFSLTDGPHRGVLQLLLGSTKSPETQAARTESRH